MSINPARCVCAIVNGLKISPACCDGGRERVEIAGMDFRVWCLVFPSVTDSPRAEMDSIGRKELWEFLETFKS